MKIKAFEKITREDYEELNEKLSKAFEIQAKQWGDMTKIREKIEELELMEIIEEKIEMSREDRAGISITRHLDRVFGNKVGRNGF